MAATAIEKRTVRPVCSIAEENDAVILQLEMPGVDKNSIELNIDGDTLSVTGRRPEAEGDRVYLVRERRSGDFRATYTIDQRVDREKVDARMENGVLTVTLHLKDEVKRRRIEVKAN